MLFCSICNIIIDNIGFIKLKEEIPLDGRRDGERKLNMLRFALCDDDPARRQQTAEMLRDHLGTETRGKVFCFSSGCELLDALGTKGADFDLYILDMPMPGLTGTELGVRLREAGGRGAFVVIFSPGEHGPDPFAGQAMGYLQKPLEPEALGRELDRVLDTIRKKQQARVDVKTRGGMVQLSLGELLYAELSNRMLCYHCQDGTTTESMTLRTSFQKAARPLLADGRFFRCSTSTVVNLHCLRGIEPDCMLMENGSTVPLTRGMLNETRRRWASYWRGDPLADS